MSAPSPERIARDPLAEKLASTINAEFARLHAKIARLQRERDEAVEIMREIQRRYVRTDKA